MNLAFQGEVWLWKGPSPYHFVSVPEVACTELRATASVVSYGWGMIPVTVRIGDTEWRTSLWPKDGRYVVPLKDSARAAAGIGLGDTVDIRLTVDV